MQEYTERRKEMLILGIISIAVTLVLVFIALDALKELMGK
jgi:hypothetical protein